MLDIDASLSEESHNLKWVELEITIGLSLVIGTTQVTAHPALIMHLLLLYRLKIGLQIKDLLLAAVNMSNSA